MTEPRGKVAELVVFERLRAALPDPEYRLYANVEWLGPMREGGPPRAPWEAARRARQGRSSDLLAGDDHVLSPQIRIGGLGRGARQRARVQLDHHRAAHPKRARAGAR